jgi:GNAT superfamily N-acetyltransferase
MRRSRRSLPRLFTPVTQKDELPPVNARVEVAQQSEIRELVQAFKTHPQDLAVLDVALAERVHQPLWPTTLPLTLNALGSVFTCAYNINLAGLMVVERGHLAARLRLLAVLPDLRRKGIGYKMLLTAEQLARQRKLSWVWMEIPADNKLATRIALKAGYKRYLPQHLRNESSKPFAIRPADVYLEPLAAKAAPSAIKKAMRAELALGDAWAQPMVESELLPHVLIPTGPTWLCKTSANGDEVGVVHLSGTRTQPAMSLWLDAALWGTALELSIFKSALDTLLRVPRNIDLRLGSSAHLRKSAAQFKALGFVPVMEQRVIFVKALAA